MSHAYETLYDDHKRAIYDDDQIDDKEYFTLQVGPVRINLFVLFFSALGLSGYVFWINRNKPKEGACPIDHTSRLEMAKLANK